jgi:hypothetical protein
MLVVWREETDRRAPLAQLPELTKATRLHAAETVREKDSD